MNLNKETFKGFDYYSQIEVVMSFSRAFGKYNNSSNNLALILFYLITQWYKFLSSRFSKRFDGMIKTYKDISEATNLKERCIRNYFETFIASGLLYRVDNTNSIVVNENRVIDFFIDGYNLIQIDKSDYLKTKLIKRKMDFTQINTSLDDFEILYSLSNRDLVVANLLYLLPHYYNIYTEDVYQWTEVKFNTLIKAWKIAFTKDFPEYGLSKAIKDTLDDELTCGLHFEKLLLKHFSADVDDCYYRKDVINDSLLVEEM